MRPLTRRDEGEYRQYATEEPRCQAGCSRLPNAAGLSPRHSERVAQPAEGVEQGVRPSFQSRSAKVERECPAMMATYCVPATSYDIGPLTIWPPRLAFQSSSPVRASNA